MFTKTKKFLLKLLLLACTVVLAIAGSITLVNCGEASKENDAPVAEENVNIADNVESTETLTSFTYTVSRSGPQDGVNGGRFYTYVSFAPAELDDDVTSVSIPMQVTRDGVDVGTVNFSLLTPHFGASDCMIEILYSQLPDNTESLAANITNEYTLTLAKGTTFTHKGVNYIVDSETVTWRVKGGAFYVDCGEVYLGFNGAQKAQPSDSRYLSYGGMDVDLAAKGLVNPQIPFTVEKDKVYLKDSSGTLFNDGTNGTQGNTLLTLNYADIDSACSDTNTTNTYVLKMSKGAVLVDSYGFRATVANSATWTINGSTITVQVDGLGEANFTHSTVHSLGFNNDSKRYQAYITVDRDLANLGIADFDLPLWVSTNGKTAVQKSFHVWNNNHGYTDSSMMIELFYNQLGSFTAAADNQDEYIVTLKKGTVITQRNMSITVANEDISWYIKGTTIARCVEANFTALYSSADIARDGNTRYELHIKSDVDFAGFNMASYMIPLYVSADGGTQTEKTGNPIWVNKPEWGYTKDKMLIDLQYGQLGDFTTAADNTVADIVTLKKGTVISASGLRIVVKSEDIHWKITGTTITEYIPNIEVNATLNSNSAGNAQDDDTLKRYLISVTTGVDWAAYGITNPNLPLTVNKNGENVGTVNFTLFTSGATYATNHLVLFEYSKLGTFTKAAENTDSYLLTLKAGTEIKKDNVTITFTSDVTWFIRGKVIGLVTEDYGEVSFTAGSAAAASDEHSRYNIYVSTGTTLVGKITNYMMPLTVSKNGETAVPKACQAYNQTHGTDANTIITVLYGGTSDDGLGGSFTTAADNQDEYIVTLQKGSIIYQNGKIVRVANDDITWYMSGTVAGSYNTTVVVTLGTTIVNDDGTYSKVVAQDGNNPPRYGVWLSAKDSEKRSLAKITGTDTVTMPMTVYKNKGTTSEKIFKMNTATVYSNSGSDGQNWDFTADNTFIAIHYSDLATYGGATAFTKASENTDAYIAVIEAGTVICVKNGNKVVVDQDFSIYMSGSVGFTSRGDASVFSTMTSFKLDYDASDNLSNVRMRFRGMLSVDVYNYLAEKMELLSKHESKLKEWNLSFHVNVNNGTKDIVLSWTWEEIKAAGVDTDGDGAIDGYAFSAVIGGLNGHWGTTLTATAYINFKVLYKDSYHSWPYNLVDIPSTDCKFAQTQYSVNSLAEKYSTMEQYAENTKLLDYLSTANGL